MQHPISHSQLKVLNGNKSTEISSLKSVKTDTEYMWNADPTIWVSQAPVLFPAIGPFRNNEWTINGKVYTIPKHGFIRHNEEITLSHRTESALHFTLNYSEKTLAVFPFKFRFQISFQLYNNKLVISHKVENLDNQEIYFSLGAHPAFKCPINNDEEYDDYYLEFEKTNMRRELCFRQTA